MKKFVYDIDSNEFGIYQEDDVSVIGNGYSPGSVFTFLVDEIYNLPDNIHQLLFSNELTKNMAKNGLIAFGKVSDKKSFLISKLILPSHLKGVILGVISSKEFERWNIKFDPFTLIYAEKRIYFPQFSQDVYKEIVKRSGYVALEVIESYELERTVP